MVEDDNAPGFLAGHDRDKRVGEEDWPEEIREALEARRQRAEYLAKHPRPVPPRALMQRRHTSDDRTHAKHRSITPTMRTGTTAKS